MGVVLETRLFIKIKITYLSLSSFGVSSIWRELVKGKHFYLEPCFFYGYFIYEEDEQISYSFLKKKFLTEIICRPKEFPKVSFQCADKPNYYISRFPPTFAAIHNEGGKSGLLWCGGKRKQYITSLKEHFSVSHVKKD